VGHAPPVRRTPRKKLKIMEKDPVSEPLTLTEEILKILLAGYVDDQGIHIETALSTLGALAGFATQMGLRQALIDTGKAREDEVFVIVEALNGDLYYFGEFANQPLLSTEDNRLSVWALVAGGAQTAGATVLPDLHQIVTAAADQCGTDQFFIPDLPTAHMPKVMPLTGLRDTWPGFRTLLDERHADPLHWGLLFAQAAQNLIIQGKDVLEPQISAKIVMESAIRMAKISPRKVQG